MRPIAILGTGNNAYLIADLVQDIGGIRISAFVENIDKRRCNENILGVPIVWIDELDPDLHGDVVISAMPRGTQDAAVSTIDTELFRFAQLIHPSALISSSSKIGVGTVVLAGAVIGPYTQIGSHCFINRAAIIGHHVKINDYCVINPGANIAGACQIGTGALIGMGALIRDHVHIGANAQVGMGSVVTKDVDPEVVVLGNPAKTK